MASIVITGGAVRCCSPCVSSTMQQRMACNLQRTLCLRPFKPIRPCGSAPGRSSSSISSGKTSLIRSLQADIKSKRRSAEEVARHYLEAIARMEPSLHSFITVNSEQALQQARELDQHIASHGTANLPVLAGMPIAVKDNICTKGLRTTAGSQVLRNFTPQYDATAAARLRQAGAILVGKTNMDEFGMGSSTENSSFQATHNPYNLSCVPGGSSGGSAAAVAAHECVGALGSDTGGSIRQPAHFCGIVGLKPTYGRVSRSGLIAYASSLDVIGTMAHTVEDAAIMLSAIAGVDASDATSSSEPVQDLCSGLLPASSLSSSPLKGKRLGLVTQCLGQGVQPGVEEAVRGAVRHLEALGAVVEEVSLPNFSVGLPAYYVLALSEASSNLSRFDGVRYGVRAGSGAGGLSELYQSSRGQGLGPEVKRRILMGTYGLSAGYYDAYYKQAQQVRSLIRADMATALSGLDALILPAAPTTAYQLGEKSSDPLEMYKGDLMTVNVNLAGLPALVVPCAMVPDPSAGAGAGRKLPVGLQMVGHAFGEAALLQLAHVFEQTLQLESGALEVA